jgi:hypothetical protein
VSLRGHRKPNCYAQSRRAHAASMRETNSMPRNMAGLLTAVGTAMSVLAVLAHSDAVLFMMAAAAGALTGSASCLSGCAVTKKNLNQVHML